MDEWVGLSNFFPVEFINFAFGMKSYASYFCFRVIDNLLSHEFQKIHLHLQSITLVKSRDITPTDKIIITIIMLKIQELKSM